ncbi:MAG: S41 family peptidase [Deferribacteraceae bacterium]|jgi:carboxyl-terminal processing protease|nr:S41 family peptidase [Deferribacteraceae bacterium]
MKGRIFSTILIAVAFAALYFGVYRMQYTSFVHAAKQEDRFSELENFSQIMSEIKKHYVEEISDTTLINGAIKGMLYELDPHSAYFTADQYKSFVTGMKGEFGGLGMTIGMRDNSVTVIAPIDDTPAYNAGIKAGDIIYKIDQTLTNGMNTDEAVKLMRGKPGTKITLTVLRRGENEPLVFNLVRDIIKVKTVKFQMFDGGIGYIRLTNFNENCSNEVEQALKALKKESLNGIILDLRSNPGGSLAEAINVSSLFLPSGKVIVSTRGRDGKDSNHNSRTMDNRDTEIPLAVLVDEGSASASEIVAGAIQDHKRGVVIGLTTFGKASVQTLLDLRGGAAMKLTTSRYYTPSGRSIQGVGIIPDVEVPRGTIVYSEAGFSVKERDLAGHLKGENEDNIEASLDIGSVPVPDADFQLKSAIQIVKGLSLYSKNEK